MTLQKKTLSVVLMTFATLILVLYIASQYLLSQGASNVDAFSTQQDLERAQSALSTNLRTLEGTTRDWAIWTSTYEFIEDHNQDYVDENLSNAGVMDVNELSLMLYVDAQANIVFVRAYDYIKGEELTLWPELAQQIYPGSPLLQHANYDSSLTGLLALSHASILLASEPILTSDGTGAVRGTLIFGRLLDDVALEQLGENILSSVHLRSTSAEATGFRELSTEDEKALAALSAGSLYFTLPLSETSLAGFTMLNDIYGNPTFLLRVDVARSAYLQSKDTVGLFVLMLVAVGLIFAFVMGVVFHHMVLARLARLKTQVSSITANQDVTTRVGMVGSDELSDLAGSINEMLSSLQRAQIEQLEGEKRFHKTFQDNPAVEMITRWEDRRIVDVNDAFLELSEYSRSEVVGAIVTELNIWSDAEQSDQIIAELQAHGSIRGKEAIFRMKSGELKTLLISIQPIEIGGEACLLTAGLDISSHKKAEELRNAKEVAEQTNQAKTEFLSRMSHELRTPLNSVLGFAQLLKMSDPSKEQEEGLDYIVKGGRHLLDLINEVLDIARIDGGQMLINLEPLEITQVLQECVDIILPLASQHDVNVSFDAHGGLGAYTILADHQRLKQVMINILANAVKYNHAGGRVLVSCEQTDINAGMLRIVTQDNGRGILADQMHNLFQPFERLGAENSEIEGTGLGLALSKRLIEAMHGRIGVESVPGKGSTFWVELPVTSAEPSNAEDGKYARTGPLAKGDPFGRLRTVLYIEDNLSNLRLVEAILGNSDLRVLAAMQGRVGLDLAKQNQPDLILLDLNLPDISGEAVLRQLREDPATADIPVIILSADAIPIRIERLLAIGAQGYLTKPFNVAQFLKMIAESLDPEPVANHKADLESALSTGNRYWQ